MTGFYRQKRELSVGAQHGDEPWLRVMSFLATTMVTRSILDGYQIILTSLLLIGISTNHQQRICHFCAGYRADWQWQELQAVLRDKNPSRPSPSRKLEISDHKMLSGCASENRISTCCITPDEYGLSWLIYGKHAWDTEYTLSVIKVCNPLLSRRYRHGCIKVLTRKRFRPGGGLNRFNQAPGWPAMTSK